MVLHQGWWAMPTLLNPSGGQCPPYGISRVLAIQKGKIFSAIES
ncbi:hypothetical protein [Coleofasciculus sp. F4-SAH-05]